MNVSMQDTYNLVWKLASVISGTMSPSILETYHSERRPVAQELMQMDLELVHAYEQQSFGMSEHTSGVDEIRQRYTGFMTGVTVTYPSSPLVAASQGHVARNIYLGMRLPSFQVVNQASARPQHLAERLVSNGYWRVLVFPGDVRHDRNRLDAFAEHLSAFLQAMTTPMEPLLIHSSPRTSVSLLDLPEIFHPFDDKLGWDYWRVFSDRDAYAGYGINEWCIVVCRPDQHVGWVGEDESVFEYLSGLYRK